MVLLKIVIESTAVNLKDRATNTTSNNNIPEA
jgi:hypothetical protein